MAHVADRGQQLRSVSTETALIRLPNPSLTNTVTKLASSKSKSEREMFGLHYVFVIISPLSPWTSERGQDL